MDEKFKELIGRLKKATTQGLMIEKFWTNTLKSLSIMKMYLLDIFQVIIAKVKKGINSKC